MRSPSASTGNRGRQYARTPFEVPEYIEVITEKVVHDITHDPVWYLTILAKRVQRLVIEDHAPHGGSR
jgi:hypothetical protein